MIFIKYFSIVLCLLSMAACNEDFFTPVVNIDLPAHQSKLVVFANLQAESDSLVVHLTRSRSALDTVKKVVVITDTFRFNGQVYINKYDIEGDTFRNAKVELFRNDVLWGVFKANNRGQYILRQKLPSDGAIYRLRVEVVGYEVVEATQKMPALVKLDSVRYVKDGAVVQDGLGTYKSNEFTYFFTDPIEAGNYYSVQMAYLDTTFNNKNPTYYYQESLDKLVQSGFLSDKSFNGKAYNWRNHNGSSIQEKKGHSITYTLFTTTAETFQFIRSKELNDNARDNPFAEPVILYSNIKNGYGLFSLTTTSIWIKRF